MIKDRYRETESRDTKNRNTERKTGTEIKKDIDIKSYRKRDKQKREIKKDKERNDT